MLTVLRSDSMARLAVSADRLEDLAGDHMRIRLLLGAPDLEHLQSPDSRRYQRILQAVSTFLRAVYRERWVERS